MIIGNNFVFIHNAHCGGSTVRSMLKATHPDSEFKQLTDWHKPVNSLPIQHRNKIKFGFVRNPWLWYCSLYEHQQPNGQFLRLFLDGKKNEFKRFLMNMLSTNFIQKYSNKLFHPVGDPYCKDLVPKFKYMLGLDLGFFSYRYIYMFFYDYEKIFYHHNRNYIFNNHDKLLSMDFICKTENILGGICKVFRKSNIPINDKIIQKWQKTPKENSKRRRHYHDYYNDDMEMINLIKFKDRMIIKKYNYQY